MPTRAMITQEDVSKRLNNRAGAQRENLKIKEIKRSDSKTRNLSQSEQSELFLTGFRSFTLFKFSATMKHNLGWLSVPLMDLRSVTFLKVDSPFMRPIKEQRSFE